MQTKPLILFTILFALLGGTLNAAIAAVPAVHISPKPNWLIAYQGYNKKVPLRSVQNGYFYQLSEEQIHVEKQADYRHFITEIISEAGIQNGSEISVNFDPTYERLDFHQIIVWRNGKPESRLNAQAFKVIADEKELSRFIYQGSYSAYCILPDIRKGDRIEYAYTITGRNPIFNNHYFRDIYFQGSQPIAHFFKALLVSPSHQLHFKSFNNPPQTVSAVKGGLRCYEWDNFQVQPGNYYDNQPGWYDEYPCIQVSDYSNWKEVTDWALNVNPIATNIKGNLGKQIALLKKQCKGDKETYFRKAVMMVQDEVRYMGIEIGQYSHRANSPEKVYNQRYGDCKDKALLLASVLNAGGIDARMVLVNSSVKAHITGSLPSPNVFDHAVLVAQLNGKPVWVDATMSYQRGKGADLYFPNYGMGLVLKAGNSSLVKIPVAKAGKITCSENYKIANETSKVKLDVVTTYTLDEADYMRDKLASTSMAETEKSYLDYYAKTYPEIERADSIMVKDDEDTNELTVTEHYLVPNLLSRDTVSGKYKASFYAGYISEQLIKVANKANTPIAVNYPYNMDYTINVAMANGWNIENEHQTLKRDAYSLETQAFTNGDTLSLNYQFSYLQDHIPVDKLDEYRQDRKHIVSDMLTYDITYSPTVIGEPFRLNTWMLLFAIGFTVGLSLLALKIYRTETDGILFAPGAGFEPLGGWLFLVLVGLGISGLSIIVSFFTTGYFDMKMWDAQHTAALKAMLAFEAFGRILMLCYAAFCLVLLINKRDILPRYITGLYLYNLVYTVADYGIAISVNHSDISYEAGAAILRAIVVAAVWIPYFHRSGRVHHTFIVPYPADNYSYEQPDEQVEANREML